MRISDWSSDVCSSDLGLCRLRARHAVYWILAAGQQQAGIDAQQQGDDDDGQQPEAADAAAPAEAGAADSQRNAPAAEAAATAVLHVHTLPATAPSHSDTPAVVQADLRSFGRPFCRRRDRKSTRLNSSP